MQIKDAIKDGLSNGHRGNPQNEAFRETLLRSPEGGPSQVDNRMSGAKRCMHTASRQKTTKIKKMKIEFRTRTNKKKCP